MKFLKACLVALLLLPFALIVAFYLWKWTDNWRYARVFFDDKVEIVRVIASKRWHDSSDDTFACTYAAIEFSKETEAILRRDGPGALIGNGWRRGGQESWDVFWEPTPAFKVNDSWNWAADPLYDCLDHLPDREADLIRADLEAEGSWYHRSFGIGTFLSAKHRIAAIFRYGD